jgi:dihydrodipicolinate synthase/N-acetylneuraminate lyase
MHLAGLHVPLLTPLDARGAVDAGAVAPHVERMITGGVDGLVALGTTGEFCDLSRSERREVAQATVAAAAGRVPVLIGVGALGTTGACALAADAAEVGAAGVLSLPPLYWKLDRDGLRRHYEAVLAATDLPLVLYDFPALAGTPVPVELIGELAAHERVVGVKLSGPELRKVHAVLRATAAVDGFSVLVGSGDLLLPALLAGGHGGILALANVDPVLLAGLYRAVAEGRFADARSAHQRALALLDVPALTSPPVLALKVAARLLGSPLAPVARTGRAADGAALEALEARVRALVHRDA